MFMNDKTIRYYDMHAGDFIAGTENADRQACREKFLQYLKHIHSLSICTTFQKAATHHLTICSAMLFP